MRLDINTFREIGMTLTRNRSRSILTGFGVFWGLFMLLFMLGGGDALRGILNKNFEGFASNCIITASNTTTKPWKGLKSQRYWSIVDKDIERLQMMIPELELVTPMISRSGNLVYGDYSMNGTVKGMTPQWAKIEAPSIKYGRYLNNIDQEQERKVCVIGKRVYKELFPEGGDPCGKYIKAGGVQYQVVGVDFRESNMNINGSAVSSVCIPISVAKKIYNRGNVVDMLCLLGRPSVKMGDIEQRVRQVMSREHLFDPTDDQAMFMLNMDEITGVVNTIFSGVEILIWLVGLGTLLAGAIGVSNIMMVTVRERTVEIGIRRAIGATPSDILSQIMLESVTLTTLAGMLSIVFTVGVLGVLDMALRQSQGVGCQLSFGTAVMAAAVLVLIGAIAGIAPARRAMNIKPVDAMRDE
ncbi:MAG: ABC transporter permease [Bacteroidales bacterium]|nr:ABC transporter permease [Bacteroidales bacterium]